MLALKIPKLSPWPSDEGVYGDYTNKSYAKHRSRWTRDGLITLYYSYTTIVAFSDGNGLHVCQNVWSSTTGKHLNWLSTNKKSRLPLKTFQELLDKAHERNEKLRMLSELLTRQKTHKKVGD